MTNLSDTVLEKLVKYISEHEIGHTFPSADIHCKELGVSRTTYREAIAILNYMNILSVKAKVGTRITPPSVWLACNDLILSRLKGSNK